MDTPTTGRFTGHLPQISGTLAFTRRRGGTAYLAWGPYGPGDAILFDPGNGDAVQRLESVPRGSAEARADTIIRKRRL
jgi:hypothetical protein